MKHYIFQYVGNSLPMRGVWINLSSKNCTIILMILQILNWSSKHLYPLSQRIQCYLSQSQINHVFYSESSCKIYSTAISGNFAHLVYLFVFGSTILTCLRKIILLIRKDRNNTKLGKLDARTHNIVLSVYETLVEILHYLELDTSSIKHFESCLATPFYSVMVLLLVLIGAFNKTQKIL